MIKITLKKLIVTLETIKVRRVIEEEEIEALEEEVTEEEIENSMEDINKMKDNKEAVAATEDLILLDLIMMVKDPQGEAMVKEVPAEEPHQELIPKNEHKFF